jgi:hypothetical protein
MSTAIKLINKFKKLLNSALVRKYIAHNKHVFFKSAQSFSKKKPVVLFELNDMHSASIAYSYLSNTLATQFDAEIVAYLPRAFGNQQEKLFFLIKKYFGLQEFGIFQSFGASDVMAITVTESQRVRAMGLQSTIVENLRDKWDVEKIAVNGVWVGDLIYDTYLKKFKKPTIDLNGAEFRQILQESIETFLWWEDYFNTHDVRAINVSHCVYNLAMPLRLAVERNIPAFQANVTHVYRMSKRNYFAYGDYRYFREIFATLPETVKSEGLVEAQRRIEQRFAGKVGVDMAYSTKSAYGNQLHTRLLQESSRKKILIATHCFFDSPHSYGNNIFPDFYEWLDFLGQMSLVTDYDWYIKTHPDYLLGTKEVIDGFIARYPKLTLLPANASHHQIIAEGIDVALTVYGTIAFEYAALGIPVINCSSNNPHIAYNFNLHPGSVDNYRDLILSLNTLNFTIDIKEVYEYYFMRHIFNTEDIFFRNYGATIKKLGGYSAQFTDAVYGEWMKEWTNETHESITVALSMYIDSGDFRMTPSSHRVH